MAADDIKIRAGKNKVKRGIHIWLVIIISCGIGVVMTIYTYKSEQEKEQAVKEKEAAKKVEKPAPPNKENFDEKMRTQVETTKPVNGNSDKSADDVLKNPPILRDGNDPYDGRIIRDGAGNPTTNGNVPGIANDPISGNAPKNNNASQQEAQQLPNFGNIIALGGESTRGGSSGNSGGGGAGDVTADIDKRLNDTLKQQQEEARKNDKQMADILLASQKQPNASATQSERNNAWSKEQQKQESAYIKPISEDPQASPYTIMQGAIIPAVLVSRINSDLPGQIVAQVTQDVYDSINHDHLIIPRGTKVVGIYNNSIANGQERIMAAFSRMIFANGRSVSLGGMSGGDASGQSGLSGDVNNHFFKIFGSSFLIAGLGALLDRRNTITTNTTSQPTLTSAGDIASAPIQVPTVGTTLSGTAGNVLRDVSGQILGRNTSIPPTITIDQGTKFNIFVSRDITIRPTVRR